MTAFAIDSDGPRMFFLSGELDLSTIPLMETAIQPAIDRAGPLTLDVSGLTFIDSSGVGAILRAITALPSGCIILHGVHNAAEKVIELLGVGEAQNLHVIPCTVLV
jgi:anti-anti-sigma factor